MRILVIEDETRIASAIKKGLQQERFSVDLAFDGQTGFDLASSETFDLIILDLMLPGLDGISICKKLREDGFQTPILMLTAKGQIQDKVLGLDTGADDYLTKPFSFDELVARVRALARRPKNSLPQILKFSKIVLDPKNFTVKNGAKNINLTAKEFSLLEYFIKNPNQILTKDQILQHVWSYESDVLPNTVEVFVRNLRLKLKSPLIQTVRGFGYKLCSPQQELN